MSGESYIIVAPALIVGGIGLVAIKGAQAAAGVAVAFGDHLRNEYESARAEREAMFAAQDAQRAVMATSDARNSATAAYLAAASAVRADSDATETFVSNRLARTLVRAEGQSGGEDVAQRLRALTVRFAKGDEGPVSVLAECVRAEQEIDALVASAAEPTEIANALRLLLEDIRSTVEESPLPQSAREGLFAQLHKAEALQEREPGLAAQAAEIMRSRTRRKIAEHLEQSTQVREAIIETFGRLDALSTVEMNATCQQRTLEIRHRLATLVAHDELIGLTSQLIELAEDARNLFDTAIADAEACARAESIEHAVASAFMSLGYRVEIGAEPPSNALTEMLVPVDDRIGMALRIDAEGGVVTEMVAFSEDAAIVDDEKQAKVCSALDNLLDRLDAEKVTAHEKYRRNLGAGRALRVVARPSAKPAGSVDKKERPLTREMGDSSQW